MKTNDNSMQVDMLDSGLLSVPEAARFLGLSKSMLYVLMDSGQLIYAKFGKARRIPKQALIEFVKANLRGGWKNIG